MVVSSFGKISVIHKMEKFPKYINYPLKYLVKVENNKKTKKDPSLGLLLFFGNKHFLAFLIGLNPQNVIGSPLGLAAGIHDHRAIVAQLVNPTLDVGHAVVKFLVHDAGYGTQVAGSYFRD